MADEIRDSYEHGGHRPRLRVVGERKAPAQQEGEAPPARREPLTLHPARLPDPETINPRQWLYGTQLLRGFVTVLVAPGGTGKSAYAMGVVLDLVSGRGFLRDNLFRSVNGAIFNLEDPMEEIERRVAALMIRHKIKRQEVNGRLFLDDGEGRGLTLASLGEDGFTVAYPDEAALISEIKANDIGVVVCDPFAESHTLEENSNPQMVKAAAAWRRVARATGCAVLLVHHVRKGEATGIDAARGAKALTDSARVGLLMSTMSIKDGETFGISPDDLWQYVRLDDAKRNMAPAAKAKWFRLENVPLGNADQDYPNGDNVQAIAVWEPPNIWDAISTADCNLALDRLAAGLPSGALYTDSRRGNGDRWAGTVLIDMLGLTEAQAAGVIRVWLGSGLLFRETYHDASQRKDRAGLRVNDAKRPGGEYA